MLKSAAMAYYVDTYDATNPTAQANLNSVTTPVEFIGGSVNTVVYSGDVSFDQAVSTVDYLPSWSSFGVQYGNNSIVGDNKTVQYSLGGSGANNWYVEVDFSNNGQKEAILTALKKIPSFKILENSSSGRFRVALLTGKVTVY